MPDKMPGICLGNLLAGLLHFGLATASPRSATVLLQTSSGVLRPNLIALRAPVVERRGCSFDHSGLDEVLQEFVKPPQVVGGIKSTLFDYKALHGSADSLRKLDKYVKSMASFDPSCLSSDGKLAFWANAYNGLIIHLVIRDVDKNDGQLPESIKNLAGNASSVWSRHAGIVGGQAMTLENVLSEARKLGDPRIHGAVNCASLSCPDLRQGAYSEEQVQAEFDEQNKKWLNNPTKGARGHGNKLRVSPIFQWHAEDFHDASSFVGRYLGAVHIKGYLPYNWNLNAVR